MPYLGTTTPPPPLRGRDQGKRAGQRLLSKKLCDAAKSAQSDSPETQARAKTNSVTSTGCTRDISPRCNEMAWKRNPPASATQPSSHRGLVNRYATRRHPLDFLRSLVLAMCCVVTLRALQRAASKAKRMVNGSWNLRQHDRPRLSGPLVWGGTLALVQFGSGEFRPASDQRCLALSGRHHPPVGRTAAQQGRP